MARPIEEYKGFISHERSKLVQSYRSKNGKLVKVLYLYNLYQCIDCKEDLWVLAQNKVSLRCSRCHGLHIQKQSRGGKSCLQGL